MGGDMLGVAAGEKGIREAVPHQRSLSLRGFSFPEPKAEASDPRSGERMKACPFSQGL